MSANNQGKHDFLSRILERKAAENLRRQRHMRSVQPAVPAESGRRARAEAAIHRPAGATLRVIAEIKRGSPSAGQIRPHEVGDAQAIASSYERGGAAAISVLCDGPGFRGTPLDLRRVAGTVSVPLLFKEFVLSPVQVELAQRVGASMVLLLVRALDDDGLRRLVDACHRLDLAPVVEAADAEELERALRTEARIVGVNARDLRSFSVDPDGAASLVSRIPADRIAVSMSGVKSDEDFRAVAAGRADAVLMGEGLMRAQDPGARLAELLALPSV